MRPPLALEAPPQLLALPAPPVVEAVSQPVSIISQIMTERDHGNMSVFETTSNYEMGLTILMSILETKISDQMPSGGRLV